MLRMSLSLGACASPKMLRSICAPYESTELIYMANPELVKAKIEKIRSDGAKNLSLITDFDFTLTRRSLNGSWADSTFKVLSSSPLLSQEFKTNSKRLYDKYAPIEQNLQLPAEVRGNYMQEWWQKSLDLVVSERLSKDKINKSVMQSKLYFRCGMKELFGMLGATGVHCYVVSAGLRPIIDQAFSIFGTQAGLSLDNSVSLCSNQEEYSEDNCITGFVPPFITCSNKSLLFTHDKYPAIKPRSNAILIGDLIDDLSMTSSLDLSTRLSIGMLNSTNEKTLEDYKNAFDIVIGVDGNLVHVAQIVESICGLKDGDYEKFGDNAKLVGHILE